MACLSPTMNKAQLRDLNTSELTAFEAALEKVGASGEIRTLKHLFLRQAAIPIRARWHNGAQGRI